MSNIFQDHPAATIISHTILIAATTWAISTFVLEDRKLSDIRSQLETQKIITDQYKTKVEILQKDMERLQAENTEYKAWLEKDEKVVPSIFVSQNLQMKEEIKALKSKLKNNLIEPQTNQSLSVGTAYIDKELDISLTLDRVAVGNKAIVYIKLPNSNQNVEHTKIIAGNVIPFEKDNKKYEITFTKVSFVRDIVEFAIDQVS